jgi:hypothetical protein
LGLSETFNSVTGLPPCWSEVLFVYMLRPVLARALPSLAPSITWVVSRVCWLALSAPIASEFACFKALTALPFGNIYKKCLYLGQIAEFGKKNMSG